MADWRDAAGIRRPAMNGIAGIQPAQDFGLQDRAPAPSACHVTLLTEFVTQLNLLDRIFHDILVPINQEVLVWDDTFTVQRTEFCSPS
jgi:hypothetical protein